MGCRILCNSKYSYLSPERRVLFQDRFHPGVQATSNGSIARCWSLGAPHLPPLLAGIGGRILRTATKELLVPVTHYQPPAEGKIQQGSKYSCQTIYLRTSKILSKQKSLFVPGASPRQASMVIQFLRQVICNRSGNLYARASGNA